MGKCVTGPVNGGKRWNEARIACRTGEFSAADSAARLSNTTLLRCMCATRGHARPPHQSIQVYISICRTPGNFAMIGGWSAM